MISQLFPVSPRNPLNLTHATISGSPELTNLPGVSCQRHCCDSASPKSAHKFLTEKPCKVDVRSIQGKSNAPSHKHIKFVIIDKVLKQPMISIEFWGTFYNVPRPIVEKHHWIHPWPGIKRTSANLVNSLAHRSSCQKRPCPCCILRKRACGSSKDIFGKQVFCSTQKKGHHLTAHREGIF